jgi:hypothetical protein
MLKLMVERWDQRSGSSDYLWSLWMDGKRVRMAPKRAASAAAAEAEARQACRDDYGREPDKVEVL